MSYPRPIQPYNLYANPIWWVSPFQHVCTYVNIRLYVDDRSYQHYDETKKDERAQDSTEWKNGQKDEEIIMKI
jgi:hypothetical protein